MIFALYSCEELSKTERFPQSRPASHDLVKGNVLKWLNQILVFLVICEFEWYNTL